MDENRCRMVDSDIRRLPSAIQLALQQIRQHPHVDDICLKTFKPQRGYYHVTVSIHTHLPNQWLPKGESPNGVKRVEAVDFRFPENYPTDPPIIELRKDFDRYLAHIQPGRDGDPVQPCYYDGSTRELLHQCGIVVIVNQIVDWLEKAATGKLIDYQHGWEPIRRDSVQDIVIANLDAIRGLVKNRKNHAFLALRYQRIAKPNAVIVNKIESKLLASVGSEPINVSANAIRQKRLIQETQITNSGLLYGESIALMVYPDKASVCEQYEPDTVQNVAQLIDRAHAYGCDVPLKNALKYMSEQTATFESTTIETPVLIFLCVRRPTHIIGSDSDIEVIAYKIESLIPFFHQPLKDIPVSPVSILYAVSSSLLQHLSGLPNQAKPMQYITLGCGSLGSKISLHLARAGNAPAAVIDNRYLSPHNAARHGLIDIDFIEKKVDALASAITSLGQKTVPIYKDITAVLNIDKELRDCIPKSIDLIMNTTASLAVRNSLSGVPHKKLPAKIMESCLFSNGRIGVLTLEGGQRNPNTSDLMLEIYEYASHDESLREHIFSDNPLTRQTTGEGCGSMTMQMPDTDISLIAAATSNKLLQYASNGISQNGQFWIGIKTEDGMGLNWINQVVPPYLAIHTDDDSSWHIRISVRAQEKIEQECEKYPDVETGGILVGSVSEARQTIAVLDVLPAPEDSKRSATEFILGTAGLKTALNEYAKRSNYALMCVGTWHSHLTNTGASPRDFKTASVIANSVPIVSVLLIKTPKHYRAVLARLK